MGGGSGLGVSKGLGFGFRGLSLGGWVLALRLFGTSFCKYAFSASYFFFPRRVFFPMIFVIFRAFPRSSKFWGPSLAAPRRPLELFPGPVRLLPVSPVVLWGCATGKRKAMKSVRKRAKKA